VQDVCKNQSNIKEILTSANPQHLPQALSSGTCAPLKRRLWYGTRSLELCLTRQGKKTLIE
jgi:hypothetical protein